MHPNGRSRVGRYWTKTVDASARQTVEQLLEVAHNVAPLLEGLEASARRATALMVQMSRLSVSNGMDAPTRNCINVPKWKR